MHEASLFDPTSFTSTNNRSDRLLVQTDGLYRVGLHIGAEPSGCKLNIMSDGVSSAHASRKTRKKTWPSRRPLWSKMLVQTPGLRRQHVINHDHAPHTCLFLFSGPISVDTT